MKERNSVIREAICWFAAALCIVALSSCDFKVPITSKPTRNIDDRLLGDWISQDGKDKMKARKLNDSIYICSINGDLFQAFHSDVGKTSFISAQDIDSADRKWAYLTYTLSSDGKELVLRSVNTKVIPVETKDSASIRKLLKKNLLNPALFDEEYKFTKQE